MGFTPVAAEHSCTVANPDPFGLIANTVPTAGPDPTEPVPWVTPKSAPAELAMMLWGAIPCAPLPAKLKTAVGVSPLTGTLQIPPGLLPSTCNTPGSAEASESGTIG